MSKKKNMKRGDTLVQLYDNKLLCSKVDEALDTGVPYREIVELCEEYGLNISPASLTRYKNKREEAVETGKPLIELLDKRTKNGNIVDIAHKRKDLATFDELTGDERIASISDNADTVYSDLEVLDDIVQKAANAIKNTNVLDPQLALKAIKLKDEITGGALQGLSLIGLRELKLREQARSEAITRVIVQYIKEEDVADVFEEIDRAEQEFYDNLDLTETGKRITKALNEAGLGG